MALKPLMALCHRAKKNIEDPKGAIDVSTALDIRLANSEGLARVARRASHLEALISFSKPCDVRPF